LDTAEEKIAYLEELQVAQVNLTAQYIEQYTKKSFEKQVADLSDRPTGLIHRRREYNLRLAEYMMQAEAEIVLVAKREEDIDKKIGELLAEKVKRFEQDHLKDYYHLETVMAAIDRLKQYVHKSGIAIHNNSSVYESVVTLRKKSQLVEELEDCASNERASIEDRLTEIKRIVKAPSFRTKLLDYHHYDAFTFAWLKQSIVSLLELIGLYVPDRRKCYNQLEKSVEPLTHRAMGNFHSRFHLFSTNHAHREYNLPAVEPVAPQLPPPAV
jgi:hypothetical protein